MDINGRFTIAGSNIFVTIIVAFCFGLIPVSGLTEPQNSPPPVNEIIKQTKQQLLVPMELMVLLNSGADPKDLEKAWRVFGVKFGPVSKGMIRIMRVTIHSDLPMDMILDNIAATRGVAGVEANRFLKPMTSKEPIEPHLQQ